MPNWNIVVWGTVKFISLAYYPSSFCFLFLFLSCWQCSSKQWAHLQGQNHHLASLYWSPVKTDNQSGLVQSVPVSRGLGCKLRSCLFLSCECVCLIILRVTVFSNVHITSLKDFGLLWFFVCLFCCCCFCAVGWFWWFFVKRRKGSDFLHLTDISLYLLSVPLGWQRYQLH